MPQALIIRVKLPRDRTKTGSLELIDPLTGLRTYGSVPVLGRAARNTASQHGNASGDPLQPFGDTPLGTYEVPRVLSSGAGTAHPADAYGSRGVIVLDPIGGPALHAKANGRTGLLIHAGRQVTAPVPPASQLRPTNGCLRMIETDLHGLVQAMQQSQIVLPSRLIVEVTETGGSTGLRDEDVDDGDPPPLDGDPIIP